MVVVCPEAIPWLNWPRFGLVAPGALPWSMFAAAPESGSLAWKKLNVVWRQRGSLSVFQVSLLNSGAVLNWSAVIGIVNWRWVGLQVSVWIGTATSVLPTPRTPPREMMANSALSSPVLMARSLMVPMLSL